MPTSSRSNDSHFLAVVWDENAQLVKGKKSRQLEHTTARGREGRYSANGWVHARFEVLNSRGMVGLGKSGRVWRGKVVLKSGVYVVGGG